MDDARPKIDQSAPALGFINDLKLVPPESIEEGWLKLGCEPVQLLVEGRRQLLWVVYRQGETAPLTSIALFSQREKPDRRAWSQAYPSEFRSASKKAGAESQSLWVRRGPTHPPLRRLAMISGAWSENDAIDFKEITAEWKLVSFNFSDTLADYAFLAFSARKTF